MPRQRISLGQTAASSAARQDQVLDHAARLLNAQGTSQRFLSDLGASLGFTRNALYHYVADFEDLLGQVYSRSCDLLAARLHGAIQASDSPLGVVKAFVAAALDPDLPPIAALNEYGLLRPDDRARITQAYEATERRLSDIIAAGVQAGDLRRCNALVAARTIINLIHWVPLSARRGLEVGPRQRQQAIGTLNAFLDVGWSIDRHVAASPAEIDLSPLLVRVHDGFDQAALQEVKRESILAAASRMFNCRGVDTTSLDELAVVLGTTKPRLYKYVGDKKTLVEECLARADRINRFILHEVRVQQGSTVDRLTALLRASTAVRMRNDLQPMRYLVGDTLGPGAKEISKQRMKRMVEYNAQLFREGQSQGLVRSFDLEGLQLINMTGGGGLAKTPSDNNAEQTDTAAEMVDILRLGLSPL